MAENLAKELNLRIDSFTTKTPKAIKRIRLPSQDHLRFLLTFLWAVLRWFHIFIVDGEKKRRISQKHNIFPLLLLFVQIKPIEFPEYYWLTCYHPRRLHYLEIMLNSAHLLYAKISFGGRFLLCFVLLTWITITIHTLSFNV